MSTDPRRAAIKAWADARGIAFTFGYIGNCSSWLDKTKPRNYPSNYDDRSWYVWFPELPRGLNPSYPNNQAGVYLGQTEDLPSAETIAAWVDAGYRRVLDRCTAVGL